MIKIWDLNFQTIEKINNELGKISIQVIRQNDYGSFDLSLSHIVKLEFSGEKSYVTLKRDNKEFKLFRTDYEHIELW